MTAERLLAATPAIVLLASMVIVLALVFGEARRIRRIEARQAEYAARPHSVKAGTAAQDAAAFTRAAIEEQLHDEERGHAA